LKRLSFLLIALLQLNIYAAKSYYPDNILNFRNGDLKSELFEVISRDHNVLEYSSARKIMFQKIYLEKDQAGYYVQDVYCETKFDQSSGVGPNQMPNDSIVNVEHTWPQSKFTGAFPKNTQKSDLHHLFPTDSKANGTRGNFPFGEVVEDMGKLKENCHESKIGSIQNKGGVYFEPPHAHKGNVARALFYFSIRYQVSIDEIQEKTLRLWDKEDPIDQNEMSQNDLIHKFQNNRNPFVDFPNLADRIDNF